MMLNQCVAWPERIDRLPDQGCSHRPPCSPPLRRPAEEHRGEAHQLVEVGVELVCVAEGELERSGVEPVHVLVDDIVVLDERLQGCPCHEADDRLIVFALACAHAAPGYAWSAGPAHVAALDLALLLVHQAVCTFASSFARLDDGQQLLEGDGAFVLPDPVDLCLELWLQEVGHVLEQMRGLAGIVVAQQLSLGRTVLLDSTR
eukprot:7368889-Alexandrium_andersonii.AAC.1